jgi:uncharacterized RDD family membrane protein YckC
MQTLIPLTQKPALFPKAPGFRRSCADIIDRIVTLPFIAYFFPLWAFVCLGYELLSDMKGQSVGKRLLGLETVIISKNANQHGQRCNLGRSLLRNLLPCLARLCYLSHLLAPLGFIYDVVEIGLVLFSKSGRRIGDLVAGTQVTTELKP